MKEIENYILSLGIKPVKTITDSMLDTIYELFNEVEEMKKSEYIVSQLIQRTGGLYLEDWELTNEDNHLIKELRKSVVMHYNKTGPYGYLYFYIKKVC